MSSTELIPRLPSPVSEVSNELLSGADVRLWLKRDDLIHSEVPGNKWRKLRGNVAQALHESADTLVTFGGAYSNHLRAVAAMGRYCGLSTVGIVRGEPHDELNPSLSEAVANGMRLSYLDRETYRRKHTDDVLAPLRAQYPHGYVIPEGGSNRLAVAGCADIVTELNTQVDADVICTPVGSGGTVAGIACGLDPGQRALGYSVLRSRGYLHREVAELITSAEASAGEWDINEEFAFGGFAKRDARLDDFIAWFDRRHRLRLEWVYVAKMLYGIHHMAQRGDFVPGTRIAAVVTGPATLW